MGSTETRQPRRLRLRWRQARAAAERPENDEDQVTIS
jgi:hypothetical protein